MNRDRLFILLAASAGLFLVSRADASYGDLFNSGNTVPNDNTNNNIVVGDDQYTQQPELFMPTIDQKVIAFANMVNRFESNNDYGKLVGKGHFTNFADHPASLAFPAPSGWKVNKAGTNYYNPATNSSAAGAPQFIFQTWKDLQSSLGLPDFSPASQDAAQAELFRQIGVIDALNANDINMALRLASTKWASLPFSNAGQNPKPLAVAVDTYNNYLGVA